MDVLHFRSTYQERFVLIKLNIFHILVFENIFFANIFERDFSCGIGYSRRYDFPIGKFI